MRSIEQIRKHVTEKKSQQYFFTLEQGEIENLLNHIPEPQIFEIPVSYRMGAMLEISACSVEEAIELAKGWEFDLEDGEYMDDSWEIDEELAKDMAIEQAKYKDKN